MKNYASYSADELLEEIKALREEMSFAKSEGNSYYRDCLEEDLFQAKSELSDLMEKAGFRLSW